MEQESLKSQLEEQLARVKERMEILNMIEERLMKMKELAQTVADNDLNQREIDMISAEVRSLEEQIDLLSLESNLQS